MADGAQCLGADLPVNGPVARRSVGELIVREVQRMSGRQAIKILRGVETTTAGERVLASLVRKRRHRRTRRLMQKASRRGNR
jgi:hypothetical protein